VDTERIILKNNGFVYQLQNLPKRDWDQLTVEDRDYSFETHLNTVDTFHTPLKQNDDNLHFLPSQRPSSVCGLSALNKLVIQNSFVTAIDTCPLLAHSS
jgi:hypothetical protein